MKGITACFFGVKKSINFKIGVSGMPFFVINTDIKRTEKRSCNSLGCPFSA
ncbi:hypothetical protein EAL2_c10060 [Peptoclostridium acidaminophilum DSM 3953]|uniref:Uncharacterized protein n=1 Tax=Peptoclostridium acidaminophilum DSM 3953 TaxID=1286171 RepID=W8T612_PEPAC|nr:hypothetical protein EAL2_c10060 [Peptoclostridium acidaminophilum DSM 3953]